MYPEDPYREPVLYDLEYGDLTEDIAWYVALARRHRGPVLELACGNGRITVPIARAGVEVHGVDVSTAMLADLERKLRAEPESVRLRVRYTQLDYRKLHLPVRYPLVIMPFNSLHHCMSHRDVLDLFAGVRGLLAPDGLFALDCYLPDPALYARDPDQLYGARDFVDPRDGSRLTSWEQSHYDSLEQVHHVTYTYQHPDGTAEQVELHLRMFYPAELRGLVDIAGFRFEALYGDFAGSEARPGANKYVMVLSPG